MIGIYVQENKPEIKIVIKTSQNEIWLRKRKDSEAGTVCKKEMNRLLVRAYLLGGLSPLGRRFCRLDGLLDGNPALIVLALRLSY